ncbi:MAG TPA: VOC family protein [Hyphomonadaceae bacterium]|jgi:predicted enzyme related to lactoylglutathione lyase|nr:VOC family protein [Hyphomonadaceae bacterium]HPN05210.1 VOC family protein [Hyphomonadaceae bacterium]
MAKVIGVGGVFFKSKNPEELIAWYRDVVGLPVESWGGVILRPEAMAAHPGAATVFAPFKADTDYFQPSTNAFMINLAVDDLEGVLARCAQHGVMPVKTFPEEANGKFAHIMDPEGNKIELWEPKPMA